MEIILTESNQLAIRIDKGGNMEQIKQKIIDLFETHEIILTQFDDHALIHTKS